MCQDDGGALPDGLRYMARSLYALTPDGRVAKAELGPQYESAHRLLQQAGMLRRPFSAVNETRDLFPVRRWAGNGFEMIRGVEDSRPQGASLASSHR